MVNPTFYLCANVPLDNHGIPNNNLVSIDIALFNSTKEAATKESEKIVKHLAYNFGQFVLRNVEDGLSVVAVFKIDVSEVSVTTHKY